jgi:O-antigen ligase
MRAASAGGTSVGRFPFRSSRLPVWPVVALFGLFPFWWILGLVDVIWIPVAAVMALYLYRAGDVRVPRHFPVWLFFLAFAGCSVIMITSWGDLTGFVYRYAIYLSSTVLFVYVYNGHQRLTARFVAGVLTCWWLTTVAGGFLGLLLPTAVIRTPMSYLLPAGLQANDLVNHMVIRRFAQYNPDSYFQLDPRPSAPFLYTNNWGNVYSLLLPFVIVYLLQVRGERRFGLLALMLPISAIPAALTLNRGMFLGIAVAISYVALRLAMRGKLRALTTLALVTVIGVLAIQLSPLQERLDARLGGETNSNTDRTSLYVQSLQLIPQSPLFGFGGPRDPVTPTAAPVGTQGQVWLLLVSHGPIAALCFVGFFVLAFYRIRRRSDPMGVACATVMLVGSMELFYYGVVPNGLPLMVVAAAMGLREGTANRS